MYERLLLTNDGSELAAGAAARAAALARTMGSDVLVMRVSRAAGEPIDGLTPDTWARQIAQGGVDTRDEEPVEAYPPLSTTIEALRDAGVERVGSLVVRGEPGEVIVEAASRLRCDVIVMSTHGLAGLRRAVLGSVADHVIRHAPGIPVLLCRPLPERADAAFRRVLVALDGSDLSEALVPHAEQIGARVDTEVVLLRVIDSPFDILAMTTPAGYPLPAGFVREAAEDMVSAQRTGAQEQLDRVASQLRAAGVTSVKLHIAEGNPGDVIVAAVDEFGCDLVLLATHGRGGLGRVLLGSVTDHVTRHLSGAAALIVPAGQPGGRGAR